MTKREDAQQKGWLVTGYDPMTKAETENNGI